MIHRKHGVRLRSCKRIKGPTLHENRRGSVPVSPETRCDTPGEFHNRRRPSAFTGNVVSVDLMHALGSDALHQWLRSWDSVPYRSLRFRSSEIGPRYNPLHWKYGVPEWGPIHRKRGVVTSNYRDERSVSTLVRSITEVAARSTRRGSLYPSRLALPVAARSTRRSSFDGVPSARRRNHITATTTSLQQPHRRNVHNGRHPVVN